MTFCAKLTILPEPGFLYKTAIANDSDTGQSKDLFAEADQLTDELSTLMNEGLAP